MLVSHIGNFKEFFNSFLTITSTVIIGAVIAYTVNPLACFVYKRLKKVIKKSEDAAWILSAVVSLIFVLGLFVGLIVIITLSGHRVLIKSKTEKSGSFGTWHQHEATSRISS